MLAKRRAPARSKRKEQLYKIIVARSDITAALYASDLMLERVKTMGDPLYYPLYAAAVICYARPFSDNKPLGPLMKHWREFSDHTLQATHDDIIAARNELIAHSDLAARRVEILPPGARVADRTSTGVGCKVGSYYFPIEKFHDVSATCRDLGGRLDSEVWRQLDALYGGMDLPRRAFPLRLGDDGL